MLTLRTSLITFILLQKVQPNDPYYSSYNTLTSDIKPTYMKSSEPAIIDFVSIDGTNVKNGIQKVWLVSAFLYEFQKPLLLVLEISICVFQCYLNILTGYTQHSSITFLLVINSYYRSPDWTMMNLRWEDLTTFLVSVWISLKDWWVI